MRPWFAIIAILAFAVTTLAATTKPATTQSAEELLATHKLEQKQEYLKALNDSPELKLPTGQVSDIFELSMDGGKILVQPVLAATEGQVRCTVKGLAGPCALTVFADRQVPDGRISGIQFAHRDFSREDEIFR